MVWLVVAEMADGPQLRAAFELVQTSGGAVWVLETHPRGECADPVGAGGFLEQVVGVGVQAGALDHDDRIDAVALE
jgi:hypothetical protein